MNESFEIGEIAIIHRPCARSHGMECLITSPLKYTRFSTYCAMAYSVDVPGFTPPPKDCTGYALEPHELRKKKPPQQPREETTTWDKCEWRPTGVTV